MDPKKLLADGYRQQAGLLAMHLADFTEADMVARPCDVANHVTWQLGHLCVATANLTNLATPGAMPAPTDEQNARYTAKGASIVDAIETKEQLLKRFNEINERSLAWMQQLTDADMDRPMPEQVRAFVATVGNLAYLHPTHVAMHIGQIQVIRRKLGKPVLF
jgi:hypothetical protein